MENKIEKTTAKRGRPTSYDSNYHPEITYKLCSLGLTDADLAFVFDVTEPTVNLWKIKHPKFAENLSRGKILADAKVAHSLFKRATGYQVKESTTIEVGHLDKTIELRPAEVLRHIPADVEAMEIWLRNRTGFFKHRGRNQIGIEAIEEDSMPRHTQLDSNTANVSAEGK
ncbi:hypothetical protein DYBT9623_00700 [Dyadobacter sp. CECT 9623]|uniref:Terminase n=2 Tax=Dyadobacter linearis TaxID=2823330 RepID=A0ABM8UKM0_9BACT|nr:hypothetical protein DYBT9623_00700 [Dyadobacter sp. CECT 9623]